MDRLRGFLGRPGVHITLEQGLAPAAAGMSARELYRTQANLHAVISYLADSIAQLPLKVYTRADETTRQRDRTSTAARLLYRPNNDQTAYELINALATEYLLFGRALMWLLPDPDSDSGYQLRLVPSEWIEQERGETRFAPDVLRIRAGSTGIAVDIPREDFVLFRTYDPGNPAGSQSPVLALRQTLYEQVAADKFRAQLWRSSGRLNASITRPASVQPWDDNARQRFVEAFREAWSGDGANAGKIPLLEDGMEIKPYKFDAQQAQYVESKQLSREDVAAAYHVNPSLIWHSSTQTYASAKDNARALYADCLGPILQMIQQRINAFLLPKLGADPSTYVEFDLAEKLKGSFEERASIIQSSVGAPWMTRNEARADNNLPPIPGGDELIVPLNVIEGGQASPQDADHNKAAPTQTKDDTDPERILIKGHATEEEEQDLAETLRKFFRRQGRALLSRIGAHDPEWFDAKRWDKELADDLEPALRRIATAHGKDTAEQIGSAYIEALTINYIRAVAEARAKATNRKTKEQLTAVLATPYDDEDAKTPADVIDTRVNHEAPMLAQSTATAIAGWAVIEAVKQAEDQPEWRESHPRAKAYKIWRTPGPNARPEHARMAGERVLYDERFSNGADWPGDDILGPDGTCGCTCYVDVEIIIP